MSTTYRVLHTTEYLYSAPVQTARHILHLTMRPCPWQFISTQVVSTFPTPTMQSLSQDAFGNQVIGIELATPHSALNITSDAMLIVSPRPWQTQPINSPSWESVRELLAYRAGPIDDEVHDALQMCFESPGIRIKREIEEYALPSFTTDRPIVDAVHELMTRVHTDFRYDPKATEVGTTVLEILEKRCGVCQDFAHFMIACLRSLGLAARYVSGYLRTDPPEGQPRLVGADASHAWISVFVPGLGWVEFDPTNNCLADEHHLIIGWGRDFNDVSPIRGFIQGGGQHTLDVGVTVTPEYNPAQNQNQSQSQSQSG